MIQAFYFSFISNPKNVAEAWLEIEQLPGLTLTSTLLPLLSFGVVYIIKLILELFNIKALSSNPIPIHFKVIYTWLINDVIKNIKTKTKPKVLNIPPHSFHAPTTV